MKNKALAKQIRQQADALAMLMEQAHQQGLTCEVSFVEGVRGYSSAAPGDWDHFGGWTARVQVSKRLLTDQPEIEPPKIVWR